MLVFDRSSNTWSETSNGAMSEFTQANFVQSGSVAFIIGNVKWGGNGKETIVRYEASKVPVIFNFSLILYYLHSQGG